jgi:uncharacterized protein YndB with AHSA1/START domain
MTAITESIEISRCPEDVYSYATDFSQFPHWQGNVVAARRESDAPLAVGSRAVVTRRVGLRKLMTTEEVTDLNPPLSWEVRGVGSIPVIAIARGAITPLDGSRRSLVTITLEFEGHGVGKLLVPLVIRRQARKQLPRNQERLRERLERNG